MQPPADNPAAVNPNILATPPRACYPWPGRQSAQGIRLQPPADNPAAGSAAVNRIGQGVNPNILATPATPAGVLSLARGVNQRKESGCNPPRITPPPPIRTSWQPRQPRGRAIPGQGVNQRKESGCNPRG